MTKKLETLFNLPEVQEGATTEEVQKVIEEKAKAGKGILLITHREALISGSQKLTDMARVR